MSAPVLRGPSCSPSEPWLTRIGENFRQLFVSPHLSAAASTQPIHLLRLDPTGKAGRAQTASLLTHGTIIAAILLLAMHAPRSLPLAKPTIETLQSHLLFRTPDRAILRPSPGRAAGGGASNPLPATHGFLAPRSAVQLAAPRMPDGMTHLLPVPVTILDEHAPAHVPPVAELGLPWMAEHTDSAGPGKSRGLGSGADSGMGDKDGQDAGDGDGDGPYARAVSVPTCEVCPYPVYTDEARRVKMQGTVTLRVLVGTNGRVSQIHVVRGVGDDLDQRAAQTVRGWKFAPARDASHRLVPAWVTIEAVFRLF